MTTRDYLEYNVIDLKQNSEEWLRAVATNSSHRETDQLLEAVVYKAQQVIACAQKIKEEQ